MVVALVSSSVDIYAASSSEGFDDEYNDSAANEEALIHIEIRDADGKIVESYEMDRTTYVNGTQHTIPAGGSYVADTYYVSNIFYAGFFFIHPDYSGYATTRDREVTVELRSSVTVHGTRTQAAKRKFSTNEEDNTGTSYYFSGVPAWSSGVMLTSTPINGRHYYDVVFTNNSTSPVTVSVLIAKD